jgi:hypothetical protein
MSRLASGAAESTDAEWDRVMCVTIRAIQNKERMDDMAGAARARFPDVEKA